MNFKTINYVPKRLRKLRGAALSKKQIDTIIDRANELSDNAQNFSQALGDAREEFMALHEKDSGVWKQIAGGA